MNGGEIEISDILINLFAAAVAVEYMDRGFQKKYAGIKRHLFFLCGFVVYFGVVTALNYWRPFEGAVGVCYTLVLIGYAMAALEGNIREKVKMGIFWVVIALFSAYLIFIILGLTTGMELVNLLRSRSELKLYLSVAGTVLKFSLGRLVLAFKKGRQSSDQRQDWIMSGAFFLVFILAVGMFQLELRELELPVRYYLSLVILTGFCMIIILLEHLHRKLEEREREANRLKLWKQENEHQEDQMKRLWKMIREAKRARHDMKYRLEVLYRLARKGEAESVAQYIEKIDKELGNFPELPQDTGNEGLNAALTRSVQECHEQGIDFRYMIVGDMRRMDSMDIGILYYNLLSNAIEANAGNDKERKIELNIWNKGNRIYCHLENSIHNSIMKENPGLMTTKEEKESHGFGMQKILEIVNKYDGVYECKEEDGNFIQEFLLLCNRTDGINP